MHFRPISHDLDPGETSFGFWRAQLIVWLLLGLIGFFIRFAVYGSGTAAAWLALVLEPMAFALTSAAAILHWRYSPLTRSLIPIISCAVLMCVAASALLSAVGYFIHQQFPPGTVTTLAAGQYRVGFIYYMGVLSIWTLTYFGVGAELAARNERISKMKAENRVVQLELEHLQRQVEPHFLFNALNAVVAEIAERPAIAEELTRRLADYLRYSLDRRGRGLCRLDEELEAVEAYIRIQSLRFDERLEYKNRVDPAALDFRLPHMTLQGLVENAIKHGMRAEHSRFWIDIDVRFDGSDLIIEVTNPGRVQVSRGPGASARRGGLSNLSRRLALYYPERCDFSLNQKADRTVAQIRLTGAPVCHPMQAVAS